MNPAYRPTAMEEILAKFLRVLVELVFKLIAALWEWPSKSRARPAKETVLLAAGVWLFGGIVAGGAWVCFFPAFILPYAMLRMGNLVAAPILSGGVGYFIARHRATANPNIRPSNCFWYLFLSAFGLVTTRFAFTR